MKLNEISEQLTFFGSPCTKDCSGHRAGYEWQKTHSHVPNAYHPSFNNGAAISRDHSSAGRNTISTGVRDKSGRFTKYTGRAPKKSKTLPNVTG